MCKRYRFEFCNKRLQNWPTVYTNLSRDQRRGLLIAFSNEHPALDHQSVCSDSVVFDKISTAVRVTADMINLQYLMIFFVYQAWADRSSTGHKNVPNIGH